MAIIRELYPSGSIKLLDPTHGFSGRLIEAYSSGIVRQYTGIELSKETHMGALKTAEWLPAEPNMEVELIHGNCLNVMPNLDNDFDLLLTSPPFLDVEQYFGVEFETNYNEWLSNFIKPFIQNAYTCLKKGGRMVVYLEKSIDISFLTILLI